MAKVATGHYAQKSRSAAARVELTRAGAAFYERSVRILSEVDLSTEIARSVAGKTTRKIAIGTVYPATIGVLPSFLARLARIARKYPDIRMHIESGTTDDIIRHIEGSDSCASGDWIAPLAVAFRQA